MTNDLKKVDGDVRWRKNNGGESMRVLISLVVLLLLLPVAKAQVNLDAGILPDSPLYGLDKAFESIQRMLAFTDRAKAELALNHARERVAEIQGISERGKPEYINDLTEEFNVKMNEASKYGGRISDLARRKEFNELIAEATAIHIEVLKEVKEKVPDVAKSSIQKAIDKGEIEVKEAKDRVAELKKTVPSGGKRRTLEAKQGRHK